MTEIIQHTQQDQGIHIITFNRPQALNALTVAAMEAFQKVIEGLGSDDTLRVLILTGAGDRAFCSGGDLNDLAAKDSEADARHFITVMGDALKTMERLPVPVIAAMNGYALGGGSEIALACDLRIADENIKMGMVQINMALTPGWGAGQRLLRVVGYAKALEILLGGEVLQAGTLLQLGLINQICEAGSALPKALEIAQQIAARPVAVVRGMKALLQAGLRQPYDQALLTERAIFPPLWADQDHLEAVKAFLQRQAEKRK